MAVCHSPSFLDNLVIFTESKHFYIIEVTEDEEAVSHQVKMKFPSKHTATSML
jgi:hypothetical protein